MKKLFILSILTIGNFARVYSQNEFRTDTIINKVIIDNVPFTLKVLHDKYNEHGEEYTDDENGNLHHTQSPITFTFIRNEDSKIIYSKKFEIELNEYLGYTFYKGQNKTISDFGKLFLNITKTYGGSGAIINLYNFSYDGKNITIKKILEFGELSFALHSKDDSEILLLTGKWNDGEGHFENHQYIIKKYELGKNIVEKYIGQTRKKYPTIDDESLTSKKLYDLIYKNERELMRGIDTGNF